MSLIFLEIGNRVSAMEYLTISARKTNMASTTLSLSAPEFDAEAITPNRGEANRPKSENLSANYDNRVFLHYSMHAAETFDSFLCLITIFGVLPIGSATREPPKIHAM